MMMSTCRHMQVAGRTPEMQDQLQSTLGKVLRTIDWNWLSCIVRFRHTARDVDDTTFR